MNNKTPNKCVAQGAAILEERDEHRRIMNLLNDIKVQSEYHSFTDDELAGLPYDEPATGYYRHHFAGLSDKEILRIINRNKHDEIIYMFEQFGKVVKEHRGNFNNAFFSSEVQAVIARRNNREEMSVLLKYYGFSSDVQMIILKEWPKSDLLWYITQHGFATEGQKYILANWSHSELMTYLDRHGLSQEASLTLLEMGNHEMIMKVLQNGNFTNSNDFGVKIYNRNNQEEQNLYLQKHAYPREVVMSFLQKVKDEGNYDELRSYTRSQCLIGVCEEKMLETVSSEFFREYIEKYSLSSSLYKKLMSSRCMDDVKAYAFRYSLRGEAEKDFITRSDNETVRAYIIRHNGLGDRDNEDWFITTTTKENRLLYLRYYHGYPRQLLTLLFKMKPLDYETITEVFLKNQDIFYRNEAIVKATTQEVAKLIDEGKCFTTSEIVALFFRNEPELMEKYAAKHDIEF